MKSLAVHSHTFPIICRHPKSLSPAERDPTSRQFIVFQSRLARSESGSSSPHGKSLFFPLLESVEAANSHSTSVGNLLSAHLQYASASYQLILIIGR